MVVFLSCVKLKNVIPCKASEMYISDYFRKNLEYARQLNPDKIYILSAKYGVLELDDIISPYNQTLKNMKKDEIKAWGDKVYNQLVDKNFNFEEEVIWLTGEAYCDPIIQYFPNSKFPMQGLPIGKRLGFLKKAISSTSELQPKKKSSTKVLNHQLKTLW